MDQFGTSGLRDIHLQRLEKLPVEIPHGRAEVWVGSLDGLAPSTDFLDEVERQRAKAFRHEQDRRRFIAGRTYLRWLLGRYLNIQPSAVQIAANEWGKPRLATTPERLFFNLSHSQDLVAFVFSGDFPVGIDVEVPRDGLAADVDGLARQFLHPAERAFLDALPEADRIDGFLRIWTRKEALLKLVGSGLSVAPERFSILPGETDLEALRTDPRAASSCIDMRDPTIISVDLRKDAVGAIAFGGPIRPTEVSIGVLPSTFPLG